MPTIQPRPLEPQSPTPPVRRVPPEWSIGHEPGPTADGPSTSDLPSPGEAATVTIKPWNDPMLADRGVDPRGDYVERFWLGVVGPSVVFLVRRLARGLEEHPGGFTVSLPDTARAIGLSPGLSRNAPISKTIERACMFGLMRRDGVDGLEVRTQLPPLNSRQLRRLPLAVRNSHESWHHGHTAA